MSELPRLAVEAERIAREAGAILLRHFERLDVVDSKGHGDPVTIADRESEQHVAEACAAVTPGVPVYGEEYGRVGDDGSLGEACWVVDPLDGTTNFLHGIPHFAISIANEEDGELVAGMIYDPLRDESFWSVRGSGAFLNNHRLRVSARKDMGDAVLATGLPFGDRPGKQEALATLEPVMAGTAGLRRFGAASLDLAYVAAGRFDAFWEFGLSPWDVAAGILLIREAGGFVTELDGGNDPLNGDTILAANDALYDPVGRMLREAIKAKTP